MRKSEYWMFVYDVEFVLLIVSYVQWRNDRPCSPLRYCIGADSDETSFARGIVLSAVLAVPVAVSIGLDLLRA